MSRYILEDDAYYLIENSIISGMSSELAEKIFEHAKDTLQDCETIEVVRCKDCKHVTDTHEKGVFNICWQHSEDGEEVSPNDYCSYAERKSDE